ncbi:MAG: hypothetical protein QNK05_20545 [Myxococcota bacterium]|nr:hypothetical protein [Myxococcota bacterium]
MRTLRWIFLLCLVVDLAVLVRIGWAMGFQRGFLVHTREALFLETSEDLSLLELPPEELVAQGFLIDRDEDIEAWKARIDAEVPYMADLVDAELDALTWVRTLVPRFSKNGGALCGEARDLMHQLQRLPRGGGQGCCSDHAQALIALLATRGVFARQVHHARHTFNEVWLPEQQGWAFVDPHYAIMARDPERAGRHLSLLELRAAFLAGSPVVYEFIGTPAHRFHHRHPSTSRLYDDVHEFRDVRMTFGNNVLAEDRFDAQLAGLPKAMRQGIGLVTGRVPRVKSFVDDQVTLYFEAYARRRNQLVLLVAVLVIGTLAYPVARLAGAPAPAAPPRQPDPEPA